MEASKPAPSLPSAPVWQATQGAGAGRPSWRRALLGVAYAALVLIAASRAHGQPTEAPPVRSGTVAPRVPFNQGSERFLAAALPMTRQLLHLVSRSDNPRDGFCPVYTFGSNDVPDFTMLGVSPNAVTISTNQFDVDQNFVGPHVFFLPKAQLLTCSGVTPKRFL